MPQRRRLRKLSDANLEQMTSSEPDNDVTAPKFPRANHRRRLRDVSNRLSDEDDDTIPPGPSPAKKSRRDAGQKTRRDRKRSKNRTSGDGDLVTTAGLVESLPRRRCKTGASHGFWLLFCEILR